LLPEVKEAALLLMADYHSLCGQLVMRWLGHNHRYLQV
jgi:ATP-dependent DNA helicase RecG